MKTILSLGAGVQSSTMALMASHGEIAPMPDYAVFADTQAEPAYIYEYLDFLESVLPFPVLRVTDGSITANIEQSAGSNKNNGRFAPAPFFVKSPKSAGAGMLRRQCTREFKIAPLERKVRELCGLSSGQHGPRNSIIAEQWIGISVDEAQRMKPSRRRYFRHRWPLIELDMRRLDCLAWMQAKGYPLPRKSACLYCPYHDDKTWLAMKNENGESWAEAVRVDNLIRKGASGMIDDAELYVHRSLRPLAEIDFSADTGESQVDMFNNECEGMCGV